MVFKSLNGQAPEYLSNLLTKCSETNVRSLRSSKQETLKVPFARTTYYEKSFSVTGHKLWNYLPIQIRQSSSLITFKNSVKSFYLNEQLNDPNFFLINYAAKILTSQTRKKSKPIATGFFPEE